MVFQLLLLFCQATVKKKSIMQSTSSVTDSRFFSCDFNCLCPKGILQSTINPSSRGLLYPLCLLAEVIKSGNLSCPPA